VVEIRGVVQTVALPGGRIGNDPFRHDRAVLPARAMEDVFAAIDRESKIKTRWIAVNTPAMSINHEAETAFEKKAAAEIAAGKKEFEGVEKGYYLRATAIPLGAGCVGCHTKFSATTDKTPRFAGLVISIPVKDE
jgi:cytochrome c553